MLQNLLRKNHKKKVLEKSFYDIPLYQFKTQLITQQSVQKKNQLNAHKNCFQPFGHKTGHLSDS